MKFIPDLFRFSLCAYVPPSVTRSLLCLCPSFRVYVPTSYLCPYLRVFLLCLSILWCPSLLCLSLLLCIPPVSFSPTVSISHYLAGWPSGFMYLFLFLSMFLSVHLTFLNSQEDFQPINLCLKNTAFYQSQNKLRTQVVLALVII